MMMIILFLVYLVVHQRSYLNCLPLLPSSLLLYQLGGFLHFLRFLLIVGLCKSISTTRDVYMDHTLAPCFKRVIMLAASPLVMFCRVVVPPSSSKRLTRRFWMKFFWLSDADAFRHFAVRSSLSRSQKYHISYINGGIP